MFNNSDNLDPARSSLVMPHCNESSDLYEAADKTASLSKSSSCFSAGNLKDLDPLFSKWSDSWCYQGETICFKPEVDKLRQMLGMGSCKNSINQMATIIGSILERYHNIVVKFGDLYQASLGEKAQLISSYEQRHTFEMKEAERNWEKRVKQEKEELHQHLISLFSEQLEHFKDQLIEMTSECDVYRETEIKLKRELKKAQDAVIKLKIKCDSEVKSREERVKVEFIQMHEAELEYLKTEMRDRHSEEMKAWERTMTQLKREMHGHQAELNMVSEQMEKELKHRANTAKQSMQEAEFEEKLSKLKKENNKLRYELQCSLERNQSESSVALNSFVTSSQLSESVGVAGDVESSESQDPVPDRVTDLEKRMGDLAATSAGSSDTDKITVKCFSPGDQAILCYDDSNGHYVVLTTSSTKHFLHPDSVKDLNLGSDNPSRPSWLIAEIVEKEYCEAKKETNRFKVKTGQRFYRVKVRKSTRGFK